MRFLHTADLHLGAVPDPEMPWSEERAKALKTTFRRIIEVAGTENVDLLLIAGDLFHHQPSMEECSEVNTLFASILKTHIVIIAGDRDYIRDTSPYLHYNWSSNVSILTSRKMTSLYLEDIKTEIHGFSYHEESITRPMYDTVCAPKDDHLHILLAHGGDEEHVPIQMHRLANAGFDYVALGHIHTPQLSSSSAIAYSGSPEPASSDDIGMRGYIMGTVDLKGCQFRWYPCASGQYATLALTVNTNTTTQQIIDSLTDTLARNTSAIYHVVLKGLRDPETFFDPDVIRACGRILDVADETLPDYPLEALCSSHRYDLISHYIEDMSAKEDPLSQKALFFGLRALLHALH